MMPGGSASKVAYIAAGPVLFCLALLLPPAAGMPYTAQYALAATLWIAFWWITEAVPIPVTSLLPIVLFPLGGVLDMERTTAAYGHRMVFLYMGGFIIALAIERWHLHRRIALTVIRAIGTDPARIVLGFMLTTFSLSMWISNTATALMMLPIALAASARQGSRYADEGSDPPDYYPFAVPLLLGVAYAASMGGICTLIGTPTNAIMAAVLRNLFDSDIDFIHWFVFAAPAAVLMLVLGWFYLVNIAFRRSIRSSAPDLEMLRQEVRDLGPVSVEERRVLALFALTAAAWMFRGLLLERLAPRIDDTAIAITGAVLLFLIPSAEKGSMLMDWKTAMRLPWGILILFGGGLALAEGFMESGLSQWIGLSFQGLQNAPVVLVVLAVAAAVNFMTEITSNVATVSLLLPILASIAPALGLHPYVLMMAATISASCAFMLPVATPPNAVIFSSGIIRIRVMARHGFAMNLIAIAITVALVMALLPRVWGIPVMP